MRNPLRGRRLSTRDNNLGRRRWSATSAVLAPAEWLDRLVSVLIDNACRYSNDGGHVEVTVSSVDERVTLTVDDSGPGIPEEERDHVFQRFHRASASPGGAGLGLSIAHAVVRATGGHSEVGSAPLGGARVIVSWPAHHPDVGRGQDGHAVGWPGPRPGAGTQNAFAMGTRLNKT